MSRTIRTTALTALCLAVAGTGLVGCSDVRSGLEDVGAGLEEVESGLESAAEEVMTDGELFTGTKTLDVEGGSLNVSCSGAPADERPVVVLMAGMGDGLDTMADFQEPWPRMTGSAPTTGSARAGATSRPAPRASPTPDGP